MLLWYLIKAGCCVMIMVSVAFITLLERKMLGLSANRKSVNKTFVAGLLQPFLDAGKLFMKEVFLPSSAMPFYYFMGPSILFFVSLLFWELLPGYGQYNMYQSVLIILCLMSFDVYLLLLSGWASGSKYSMLGSLRVCCVSVSMDVAFTLFLVLVQLLNTTLVFIFEAKIFLFLLFPLWFILILMATMTCPFDMGEAESELVGGLITEHMGLTFIFLFLAEYGNMISFSFLTSGLFFNNNLIITLLIFMTMLLCHCTFPRVKTDVMMGFLWLKILPILIMAMVGVYVFL